MKERTMASGTVKWFNAQKGYGFIQPDDGSKDVFVHISAVERAGLSFLNENQKLSYELETRAAGEDFSGQPPNRVRFHGVECHRTRGGPPLAGEENGSP